MKYVVNSAQMKRCDKCTIEYFGVPSMVLMERAALSVVEELEKRIGESSTILIVCGNGNNGGDGIAIGRLLYLKGHQVHVAFVGREEAASLETKEQLSILRKYNISCSNAIPCKKFDVVIDSIFGIGLCREIQGKYKDIIQHMNDMDGLKVAVDISSGVNADNGQIMGIAFHADLTVTFAFAKIGQLLYPGADYTGQLIIKEIGIDTHGFMGEFPTVRTVEAKDLSLLPSRPSDSNKGTFGKVLVIAGSFNMAGAAAFSAKAVYRTGAGLVKVFTHACNRVIIQSLVPEAVLDTYEEQEQDLRKLKECIDWATVIVIGPGIGQSQFSKRMIETVLEHGAVPCVIDADALNIIAREKMNLKVFSGEIIITPHIGEMARLCRKEITYIKENAISVALDYAKSNEVTVVLKDARTITAFFDGQIFINLSGNAGMATGGSGDVLTGIIAGMLAQGCSIAQSASAGVYLHGLSGDKMAQHLCQYSLMASDIIDGITLVLKEGK